MHNAQWANVCTDLHTYPHEEQKEAPGFSSEEEHKRAWILRDESCYGH